MKRRTTTLISIDFSNFCASILTNHTSTVATLKSDFRAYLVPTESDEYAEAIAVPLDLLKKITIGRRGNNQLSVEEARAYFQKDKSYYLLGS